MIKYVTRLIGGKLQTTKATNARASMTLSHNGVVGNGDWIGYTQSITSNDTPILIPWDSRLEDITFSNSRTSVDGTMSFFKNGSLTSFFDWTFTNVNKTQFVNSQGETFASGDTLEIQWSDSGQNPNDMGLVLWFTLD